MSDWDLVWAVFLIVGVIYSVADRHLMALCFMGASVAIAICQLVGVIA